MDKIFIQNLRLQAILGVYPHERVQPQTVRIDLILETDTRPAAFSDDLADCVDYDALSQRIRQHVRAAARQTVEALAQDVANLCLQTPRVERVTVRISKPEALPDVENVGVEITRPLSD